MLLIPAIDLKAGQCVRLRQGAPNSATVYSDDPAGTAGRWLDAGAKRLHVVDLDGAFAGRPVNADAVEAIVAAAGDVPVQVGGGIRDSETAGTYLNAGASQVIIGTRAVEDQSFLRALAKRWPRRIMLGVDAKNGKAATRGWSAVSGTDAVELVGNLGEAGEVGEAGIFAIIYTDIARDGMLSGPNIEATRRVAEAVPVPVIASGGVKDLDDLRALKALRAGLLGAISGAALYQGTLDFRAGQRLLSA